VAHGARSAGLTAVARPRRAITVYRVARAIHPLFDGSGAARFGARWTSPGRPAIYAAGSYAGALMEVLVHARRTDLKVEYRCLVIHIPMTVGVQEVKADAIKGWDAPDYISSRSVGDQWLDAEASAVLCVPSITAWPHERHYIINPRHRDMRKLRLGTPHPVLWDERLLPKR
jgi:RES domain-containing protein